MACCNWHPDSMNLSLDATSSIGMTNLDEREYFTNSLSRSTCDQQSATNKCNIALSNVMQLEFGQSSSF